MTRDDLTADYRRAGFSGTLGFGRNPALLIVDMCMAYLDPASPLYAGVEAEKAKIETLLAAFRARGLTVAHSRVEYQPGGADGGHFFRKVAALKCFERDNPLGACPDSLVPVPGEIVVTKQYASAYFGTPLAEELKARGIDCVVVTGVSTSGCVRASALDTLQNGFIPLVVSDACGDRDQQVHAANLFDLGAKYADILTAAEILDYLEGLER